MATRLLKVLMIISIFFWGIYLVFHESEWGEVVFLAPIAEVVAPILPSAVTNIPYHPADLPGTEGLVLPRFSHLSSYAWHEYYPTAFSLLNILVSGILLWALIQSEKGKRWPLLIAGVIVLNMFWNGWQEARWGMNINMIIASLTLILYLGVLWKGRGLSVPISTPRVGGFSLVSLKLKRFVMVEWSLIFLGCALLAANILSTDSGFGGFIMMVFISIIVSGFIGIIFLAYLLSILKGDSRTVWLYSFRTLAWAGLLLPLLVLGLTAPR